MILLSLCVCLAAVLHQPEVQAALTLEALKTSNADQQQIIVNTHNDLRRSVQPSARNMLKMQWDPRIARNAERWASGCQLKHSTSELRRVGSTSCGENLFMSSHPAQWDTAIRAWYGENKDFVYGSGAKSNAVIGHYTQVVWYRSHQVGCAVYHCPGQRLGWFYVCQYCPAGNIAHLIKTPYASGPPCADCPNHCENKLCTNPCGYDDKYRNCADLKKKMGCGQSMMNDCPASCKCTTEIK